MRIARALTIKVTLPLFAAGATILSGAALTAPAIVASVNSVPVASAVATGTQPHMYYGAHPNMYYG